MRSAANIFRDILPSDAAISYRKRRCPISFPRIAHNVTSSAGHAEGAPMTGIDPMRNLSLASLASFEFPGGRSTCLNFQPNALWIVKVSGERMVRVTLGGSAFQVQASIILHLARTAPAPSGRTPLSLTCKRQRRSEPWREFHPL